MSRVVWCPKCHSPHELDTVRGYVRCECGEVFDDGGASRSRAGGVASERGSSGPSESSRVSFRIMSLDRLAGLLAEAGVPGVVLLTLIHTSSWYGAAAFTSSLALLGGPLGMLGGLVMLGVIGLISRGLGIYGFERICRAWADAAINRRHVPKEVLLVKVGRTRWLSRDFKDRICKYIRMSEGG